MIYIIIDILCLNSWVLVKTDYVVGLAKNCVLGLTTFNVFQFFIRYVTLSDDVTNVRMLLAKTATV